MPKAVNAKGAGPKNWWAQYSKEERAEIMAARVRKGARKKLISMKSGVEPKKRHRYDFDKEWLTPMQLGALLAILKEGDAATFEQIHSTVRLRMAFPFSYTGLKNTINILIKRELIESEEIAFGNGSIDVIYGTTEQGKVMLANFDKMYHDLWFGINKDWLDKQVLITMHKPIGVNND